MSRHNADLDVLAPLLVERVGGVGGVEAVALGGSRARGDHFPDSDYDLGIYYRGDLDIEELQTIADEYSDTKTEVSDTGGWGPWVDGGAWLTTDGTAIDFIFRDLDRVRAIWADCLVGRYVNEMQPGHPLGFWSHAYAGEVALSVPLHDPLDELTSLKAETSQYPDALAAALIDGLWEASFSIAIGRKAIERLDTAFVVGCLFRAIGVMSHAVHGHDHRWLLNEKGAVASTARLPSAPAKFEQRVNEALSQLSAKRTDLAIALAGIEALVTDTTQLLTPMNHSMPSSSNTPDLE